MKQTAPQTFTAITKTPRVPLGKQIQHLIQHDPRSMKLGEKVIPNSLRKDTVNKQVLGKLPISSTKHTPIGGNLHKGLLLCNKAMALIRERVTVHAKALT